MVQHMLLLLVAPLLLLGGQPVILALRALPAPAAAARRPGARSGTRRSPALLRPGAVLAVVVLAPTCRRSTTRRCASAAARHSSTRCTCSPGCSCGGRCSTATGPGHRLSGLGRLVYLLAAMLPMALIGAYLNRHATLVLSALRAPAHALGISALDDQRRPGRSCGWPAAIMTAVGLWAVVAAMVAEERRLVAREARLARPATGSRRREAARSCAGSRGARGSRVRLRASSPPCCFAALALIGLRRRPRQRQPAHSAGGADGRAAPRRPSRPSRPGPGNPTATFPDLARARRRGLRRCTRRRCASCHGIALQGTPGYRAVAVGVGPGPVDFYLSTGRMPLEQPARASRCANHARLHPQQIDALIAYISSFGGPAGADRRSGEGQPGARLSRVHAELRRLPSDRRPRRDDGRRAGPRPAGRRPPSRSPRRCGWGPT